MCVREYEHFLKYVSFSLFFFRFPPADEEMVPSENRPRRAKNGIPWLSHQSHQNASTETAKTQTLLQLVNFQEENEVSEVIGTSQKKISLPQPQLPTTPFLPKANIKHVTAGPFPKTTTHKPPTLAATFSPEKLAANIRLVASSQKKPLRESSSRSPQSKKMSTFKGIFTHRICQVVDKRRLFKSSHIY
jgi:hypothetical protein